MKTDTPMKPIRIDPIIDDEPTSGISAAFALSAVFRVILRAQVDLVEARPIELSAIVETTLTLGDTWVDRHLVPCDPLATRPPQDDSESVGLVLDHLVKDSAPSISAVIGPSGAGKSSCCKMLAAKASISYQNRTTERYPIYLEAPKLDLTLGQEPISAIARGSLDSLARADNLQDSFVEGIGSMGDQVLVIIDSVDSLLLKEPENGIDAFVTLLKRFRSSKPESQLILSCRDEAWFDPRCYVLRNISTAFALRPLSLLDVNSYLSLWHKQRGRIGGPTPTDLMMTIVGDSQLRDLLGQPFMLALSAHVVEKTGAWPRATGGLCEELVETCLNRIEHIAGGRVGRRLEYKDELLKVLELMAWKLSSMKHASDRSPEFLSPTDVRDCVLQAISGADRTSVIRAAGGAMDFLDLFHAGTGIFSEISTNEFGFCNDAFHLFFAGRYLAMGGRARFLELTQETLASASDAIVVWAQGRAHRHEIDTVLLLVEDLVESTEIEHQLLAGRLLGSVYRVCKSERHRWLERWQERVRAVLGGIRSNRTVPIRSRARAGEVLSEIGDPLLTLELESTAFVSVKGGRVRVGSSDTPTFDDIKYKEIHWYPPFEAFLQDFSIAVYPTTNHAYSHFIHDNGYERLDLWTSNEARSWVTKAADAIETYAELVRSSLGLHYKKDIEAGFMSVVDYESMRDQFLDRLLRRSRPLHWLDPRFSRPNQPVVGVNFWEACAYCEWLTGRLHSEGLLSADQICRLPTEEEWERAAASEGNHYPWGNDWDDNNAHVRSADWIPGAVSIGTFPWAASPWGCQDMIGNVWDWTLSSAVPYSGRKPMPTVSGLDTRITRGGSWLAKLPSTRRVVFRSYDPPCNAYADLGFRPVIAQKIGT